MNRGDKAFLIAKVAAVVFLLSLPIGMILGYAGNSIALAYCNGLNSFSGIVLSGMRKLFEGLEAVIASVVNK